MVLGEPEARDDHEAEHEPEEVVGVRLEELRRADVADLLPISASGSTSRVMAIATTASTKVSRRSRSRCRSATRAPY